MKTPGLVPNLTVWAMAWRRLPCLRPPYREPSWFTVARKLASTGCSNSLKKDQIDWGDYKYHDFYKSLLGLKRENQALWNGDFGGEMVRVHNNYDEQVFSFVREKNGDQVFVVLNLSDEALDVNFTGDAFAGQYNELFTEENVDIDAGFTMSLEPWGYYLFHR